jgi:hypothetical protein
MRWLQSEAAVLWPARAVAAQGDRVQQCAVVEASSSPASSFTFGQMASTASATAACSPARTAPRRSRERVRSWVWPRRWPRRRSRSIPRRRRCLPRLARAVAAACSSSRPSRLAARHATADRNEDRYHGRNCNSPHPNYQGLSSLVNECRVGNAPLVVLMPAPPQIVTASRHLRPFRIRMVWSYSRTCYVRSLS